MARKQFLLRIDPELWKFLEKWAADDLRSVNAQIEWLLREAVRGRRGGHPRQDSADDDSEERRGDDVADEQQAGSAESVGKYRA
jgi:hypothetical protein